MFENEQIKNAFFAIITLALDKLELEKAEEERVDSDDCERESETDTA